MEPVIEIKDLCKSFDRKVLDNLTLSIKQGEIIGITGRSGIGKTTLLRTIMGLETFDSGKINIFGKDKLSLEERRKISMSFQKPVLFNESVMENVMYGLKIRNIVSQAKAEKVLKGFGIEKFDKNVNLLSGGEAQRVDLARNFALEPKILLLDEPSANLDLENVKILLKMVKKMKKNKNTVIISTHDTECLKICDKVYTIEGGKMHG